MKTAQNFDTVDFATIMAQRARRAHKVSGGPTWHSLAEVERLQIYRWATGNRKERLKNMRWLTDDNCGADEWSELVVVALQLCYETEAPVPARPCASRARELLKTGETFNPFKEWWNERLKSAYRRWKRHRIHTVPLSDALSNTLCSDGTFAAPSGRAHTTEREPNWRSFETTEFWEKPSRIDREIERG